MVIKQDHYQLPKTEYNHLPSETKQITILFEKLATDLSPECNLQASILSHCVPS